MTQPLCTQCRLTSRAYYPRSGQSCLRIKEEHNRLAWRFIPSTQRSICASLTITPTTSDKVINHDENEHCTQSDAILSLANPQPRNSGGHLGGNVAHSVNITGAGKRSNEYEVCFSHLSRVLHNTILPKVRVYPWQEQPIETPLRGVIVMTLLLVFSCTCPDTTELPPRSPSKLSLK